MRRCLLAVCLFLAAAMVWAQDKPYHGDGPDDVLEHLPMAAAFALKAAGADNDHTWPQFLCGAALSYAFTAGVTYSLKHTIHERRPDGTDHRSLPSGHTAFAFSGALSEEDLAVARYGIEKMKEYMAA